MVSVFVLMICLLVVILGGIQFYQVQKKGELEEQIADTQQALKELEKKVGEVDKYKEARKELETKLAIIERLQKGKTLVVQLLDGTGETIPEKMWLDELGLKASRYSMEGYAVDNETIATFMKELERSGSFHTVELLWTEQKEVDGIGLKHFSLVATLAPPQLKTNQPKGNKAGTASSPSAKNAR
jgi:type IV pilus assembly protein PilN